MGFFITNLSIEEQIGEIRKRDGRYDERAYSLVLEGVDKACAMYEKGGVRKRHLSARETIDGINCCSIENFGPMADYVLGKWGINSFKDFGEIIYNLVDVGLLNLDKRDKREDFDLGEFSYDTDFSRFSGAVDWNNLDWEREGLKKR